MAGLNEYKCPNCGGAIAFDSGIQKMKCPYCDTEFEMETLLALDAELKNEQSNPDYLNFEKPAGNSWLPGEEDGMFVYICNSCGGEIIGEATTGATACPFCGNPVVMKEQFKGQLRPDFVIPFKLDKKAAKEQYLKHLTGKKLLPKVFKDQNHIDEIKGVYVPFWMFDADATANIRYKATRTRFWSDANYNYTQTSIFSIFRGGSLSFEGIPVDGSQKMADDLMDSLEPFDLRQAVDFQTAYLAGYFADKYDVTAEDSMDRAALRIKNSTADAFRQTVNGYATVVAENTNVQTKAGRIRYGLLPVWLLNTNWNGQKYTFAMNGQTGKFVGNLPMDKKLKNKYFAIAALIGAGIAALIVTFWWLIFM